MMTQENDVVMIYFEDQPLTFARIEEISPDIKKDWYHIKLLILQVPLQTVSWILKNEYINGTPFTMSGKKMKIELVVSPEEPKPPDIREEKKPDKPQVLDKTKIISLTDRAKK
jgi:hypothetical protein